MRSSSIPSASPNREILEFFFQIHDPTTKDRQGNDIGSAYRSEIFSISDEQRRIAEETIADVDATGLWPGTVVTEISDAVPFWEAEPEHQDYLQHYPNGYTCHFPRPGWKLQQGQSDEKAHGPRRGPYHTATERKVRQSSDVADRPEINETPCN